MILEVLNGLESKEDIVANPIAILLPAERGIEAVLPVSLQHRLKVLQTLWHGQKVVSQPKSGFYDLVNVMWAICPMILVEHAVDFAFKRAFHVQARCV